MVAIQGSKSCAFAVTVPMQIDVTTLGSIALQLSSGAHVQARSKYFENPKLPSDDNKFLRDEAAFVNSLTAATDTAGLAATAHAAGLTAAADTCRPNNHLRGEHNSLPIGLRTCNSYNRAYVRHAKFPS